MLRLMTTVLAGLTLAVPAAAFDDIDRFLPLIGLDTASPVPFSYASATVLRDGPNHSLVMGNTDDALRRALRDPGASARTGIDFSAVTSIFLTGGTPQEIAVIFGEPRFAAAAPKILTAAGYGLSTEPDGTPLLSKGEDYHVDLLAMDDPLGNGVGRSQRLLLGEDYLLRTAATPVLRLAEEALMARSDRSETRIWRNLFDIVETASGPGPTLDAATGYIGPSIFGDTYTVMAATHTEDRVTAHMALTFPSFPRCEGAPPLPAELKRALKLLSAETDSVELVTKQVDETCYGVFSMEFGPEDPMAAIHGFQQGIGL